MSELSPSGKIAISVKEASQLMGVSVPKMYDYVHMEGFPVIRDKNIYRIPYRAFVEWANLNATQK